MLLDFNDTTLRTYGADAEFGLERESLRVNRDGTLAMTKHPFSGDVHIDRDFCENQVEMITDVFTDADALIGQVNGLLDQIDDTLRQKNECLWNFSNPPIVCREEDIPAAVFEGGMQHKSEYRAYLAEKYGKKKMLFSGIHFNYSFTAAFLNEAARQERAPDYVTWKSEFYLRLSRRLTEYAWLVVFLTAASPVTDPSFGIESNRYASIRCSEQGYWNDFVPVLNYTSFPAYLDSIEAYIRSGALRSVSELYYPVRLKPRGISTLQGLRERGVNHVELRVIDVNPLTRAGIMREDIRFLHLLMLYLVSLPDADFGEAAQLDAIRRVKAAAEFDSADIRRQAADVLAEIESFARAYFPHLLSAVSWQQKKLQPGGRYADEVSRRFSQDYVGQGLLLSESYRREKYV